jgi:pantetheine-phosphate adenylyltransferase
MKQALYAGSFDPWTFGHQFVLESALAVFDKVHVVCGVNLAKQSALKPEIRARIIAHAMNPFCDWWSQDPPFVIDDRVIITSHEGLIADYANDNHLMHFIRGLRSTSDFEAEFNLYFSNQAINSSLQTWAIMCPPNLLHCSSTFVKTVVGRPNVKFVGTHFVSQSLILGTVRIVGQLFDLIQTCSQNRFDTEPLNLNSNDVSQCLQLLFSSLHERVLNISRSSITKTSKMLDHFLKNHGKELRQNLKRSQTYPIREINLLWAILAYCVEQNLSLPDGVENGVSYILSMAKNLGKTSLKLFDENEVVECYSHLKK